MRGVCRHLVGCRGGGSGEDGCDDGSRHDRHATSRRRLEVLVVRRVDRRHRRGRGTRHAHQLLVSTAVDRAVDVLRAGGLVAFPTETVYGLGADARNAEAVRRLFAVKGRPPTHPVIAHLGARTSLDDWADAPNDHARALAAAFWPGPLTIVVTRRPGTIVDEVTGGRATVGLRVPDHPLALELLDAFGG